MTNPRSLSALQNIDYIEALHQQWQQDPRSVGDSWQAFFQGFALGQEGRLLAAESRAQSNVASLIYAYRSQGHLAAQIDPLSDRPQQHPALDLECFGFGEEDLERLFDTGHLMGAADQMSLRDIVAYLRDTYCGSVGVEYIHVQDREIRRWLQGRMEPCRNRPCYEGMPQRAILEHLVDAELFERFTHARYPGQKRFSLEGAETLIPALRRLVGRAAELGVREVIFGMAHRGRLNVMANIIGMSYEQIFSEFEGNFLPESVHGDGDVKYHKGYSSKYTDDEGRTVHLSLTANPSHLEAVNPVVEGRVRAKQRQHQDTAQRKKVVPVLIHGDAAFSGQGIVAETLNLSQLPGYRTGGTVHLIINNQIGFTTAPDESRSSAYSTDVAKMIEAPIFHVNGDDPEAVVFVTELALDFRQQFGRDVVVDVLCYRRHGHNEADDPAFTQPLLYEKIRGRPSTRELFTEKLREAKKITAEESEEIAQRFRDVLESAHEAARSEGPKLEVQAFEKLWAGMGAPFSFDAVDTRVEHERLVEVARALCSIPEGFELNRKIARQLPARLEAVQQGREVDWALAESLAFGTLLREGIPVRLSGQDSVRGTFSQRHAHWYDTETAAPYSPLANIHPEQARFCAYNSTLSEAAVLGFEYGYSLSEPQMLILWEAQFGDFANGAQVIIDQFLLSAESKWQRDSGIVMLLPHGYEGQGPEHSNAYLERYLAGCAEDNVQVCYPSTPAQYFHLLRRQMHRPIRLPLVVMTPKSLLRHKACVSAVGELTDGGFEEFVDDPSPPAKTRRLVLCSGKVYYDLIERRGNDGASDVAIVRVEQFYPFHREKLCRLVQRYRDAEEVAWVQEEPQNRGGWTFVMPRLLAIFADKPVIYIGRDGSASPATGSLRIHREEQQRLVQTALGRDTVTGKREGVVASRATALPL